MAYLFKVVKKLAHAVKHSTEVEGIRIVQNNGEAAGQLIFHLHVHIIPMKVHNQFSHNNSDRDAKALEEDAEKTRLFL